MSDLDKAFSKYHTMTEEQKISFRRELRRQIELAQELATEFQATYLARKAIEKAKQHD